MNESEISENLDLMSVQINNKEDIPSAFIKTLNMYRENLPFKIIQFMIRLTVCEIYRTSTIKVERRE